MSERNLEGSFSSKHFASRHLSLSLAINSVIDTQLAKVVEYNQRGHCKVNRRKAQIFQDEGNVDHEGKHSIFGQIMQQMKRHGRLDLRCFRLKDVNSRAYRIDFIGENSIDVGGPYRDSIVNVVTEMEMGLVPLLIKSPNNRNEHGANRDCFVLDPTSKSPTHLEMY